MAVIIQLLLCVALVFTSIVQAQENTPAPPDPVALEANWWLFIMICECSILYFLCSCIHLYTPHLIDMYMIYILTLPLSFSSVFIFSLRTVRGMVVEKQPQTNRSPQFLLF